MHHNCNFRNETEHGYGVVEVVRGYCEVGLNCHKKCPFSFGKKDEKKVNKVYEEVFNIKSTILD